ncbi:MAG: hypothetical protein WBO74_06185 [Thermoanaerobaculia bacterium]
MRHSNLFKSIAGGALLLAVLGLAYGLNQSRTGSSETLASLDLSRTSRPARLPITADKGKPLPSFGSIQGIQTRADVREPAAVHLFAQPELQNLIQVIDSPGRTEPKSRPSENLEATDSSGPAAGEPTVPQSSAPTLVTTFAGPDFDDNQILNSEYRIPPDPNGAVGQNHVVATVNEILEIRQKTGVLDSQGSLDNFLTNLGFTPLAFTFDPKVTYDPWEDRFVVLVLGVSDIELDGTPTDESSIFIAVSDDGNPNGTWCSTEIDAKLDVGSNVFTWADYPGLVVDEEAVFVTASLFQFASEDPTLPFGGIRLWAIDKGTIGGLYDCDTADVNLFNPYAGTSLDLQAALQPAAIAGNAPAGLGTFLVGYSGTTLDTGANGSNSELQQVIRVDDPLGSTTFTKSFVDLGNIEDLSSAPQLPNASQSGSAVTIETNDRSTLTGFWRGNSLYTSQSINPTGTVFPGNNGQATAYWAQIDTTDLNNLVTADHGVIGGEDIASGTHTFFPSIAPVIGGYVAIGFAASGPSIHPGAYFTWRSSSDSAGSNRGSVVLQAGEDVYVRTRQGDDNPNRWGDWSDAMFDPSESGCFWVFNQYAMTQGSPTNTGNGGAAETGRWATEWGKFCINSEPIFSDGFESGDTSAWSSTRP